MTRATMLAMALLMVLTAAPALAAVEDEAGGGWYVAAGAGIQRFESWDAGARADLLLARKLPYRHADTPRSSIAVEAELSQSTEPMTQRRAGQDSQRRERELTTAGLFLAHNTFVTARIFHRARLGGVFRYLERDSGGSSRQAALAFGLGLGVAISPGLELLADTGIHYSGSPLLYVATVSARLHF